MYFFDVSLAGEPLTPTVGAEFSNVAEVIDHAENVVEAILDANIAGSQTHQVLLVITDKGGSTIAERKLARKTL